MPVWRVRTSTSSTSGGRRVTERISPVPGELSQNARAVSGIGASSVSVDLCRSRRELVGKLNHPRVIPVLTGVRQRYAGHPHLQPGHQRVLTVRVGLATFGSIPGPTLGLYAQFALLATLHATIG